MRDIHKTFFVFYKTLFFLIFPVSIAPKKFQLLLVKDANGFLLPVNFTQPEAVDNSGSIARTNIKPEGFNLPLTTFEDMMIEYFAYDYDGNVAICQVCSCYLCEFQSGINNYV